MKLQIANYIPISRVEGPGARFAIWVQGCTIQCKDCWNSHLWTFKGGNQYEVDNILNIILQYKEKIEGITIVGGEPLDQVESIINLIEKVQKNNLTVMLYTGYKLEEIKNDKLKNQAFMMSDIVVYEPFISKKRNLYLKWRGSDNQKIKINNPIYKDIVIDEVNEVEIHINDDGNINIIGFPDEEILKVILNESEK